MDVRCPWLEVSRRGICNRSQRQEIPVNGSRHGFDLGAGFANDTVLIIGLAAVG